MSNEPLNRASPYSIAEWLEANTSPAKVIAGGYTFADLMTDLNDLGAEMDSGDSALANVRDKFKRLAGEF